MPKMSGISLRSSRFSDVIQAAIINKRNLHSSVMVISEEQDVRMSGVFSVNSPAKRGATPNYTPIAFNGAFTSKGNRLDQIQNAKRIQRKDQSRFPSQLFQIHESGEFNLQVTPKTGIKKQATTSHRKSVEQLIRKETQEDQNIVEERRQKIFALLRKKFQHDVLKRQTEELEK